VNVSAMMPRQPSVPNLIGSVISLSYCLSYSCDSPHHRFVPNTTPGLRTRAPDITAFADDAARYRASASIVSGQTTESMICAPSSILHFTDDGILDPNATANRTS